MYIGGAPYLRMTLGMGGGKSGGTPTPTPTPTIIYDSANSQFSVTSGSAPYQWYNAGTASPIAGQTSSTAPGTIAPGQFVYCLCNGVASNQAIAPADSPPVVADFSTYSVPTYLSSTSNDPVGTYSPHVTTPVFTMDGSDFNDSPSFSSALQVVSGILQQVGLNSGSNGFAGFIGTHMAGNVYSIKITLAAGYASNTGKTGISIAGLADGTNSSCLAILNGTSIGFFGFGSSTTPTYIKSGVVLAGGTLEFIVSLPATGAGAASFTLKSNGSPVTPDSGTSAFSGLNNTGGTAQNAGPAPIFPGGLNIGDQIATSMAFQVFASWAFFVTSVTVHQPTLSSPNGSIDVVGTCLDLAVTNFRYAVSDPTTGSLIYAFATKAMDSAGNWSLTLPNASMFGGIAPNLDIGDAATIAHLSQITLGTIPYYRPLSLGNLGMNMSAVDYFGAGDMIRNRGKAIAPTLLTGTTKGPVAQLNANGDAIIPAGGYDGLDWTLFWPDVLSTDRLNKLWGMSISKPGTLAFDSNTLNTTLGTVTSTSIQFTPLDHTSKVGIQCTGMSLSPGDTVSVLATLATDATPTLPMTDWQADLFGTTSMGSGYSERWMKPMGADAGPYWGLQTDTTYYPNPTNAFLTPEFLAQDMKQRGGIRRINFCYDMPLPVMQNFIQRYWTEAGIQGIQDRFVEWAYANEWENSGYNQQFIYRYLLGYNLGILTGSVPSPQATLKTSGVTSGTGVTTVAFNAGDVFICVVNDILLVQCTTNASIGSTVPNSGSNANFTVLKNSHVDNDFNLAASRALYLMQSKLGDIAKAIMGSKGLSALETWLANPALGVAQNLIWLRDTYGKRVDAYGSSFYAGFLIDYTTAPSWVTADLTISGNQTTFLSSYTSMFITDAAAVRDTLVANDQLIYTYLRSHGETDAQVPYQAPYEGNSHDWFANVPTGKQTPLANVVTTLLTTYTPYATAYQNYSRDIYRYVCPKYAYFFTNYTFQPDVFGGGPWNVFGFGIASTTTLFANAGQLQLAIIAGRAAA